MDRFKKGATRWVFLVGRYAFKIPSLHSYKNFLNGLLANMQEVTFNGFHPILCPVVFKLPLGLLVVMPRLEPIDSTQFALALNVLHDDELELIEAKMDSFGQDEEYNVFAIDYGS